jgi:hypothetical protein
MSNLRELMIVQELGELQDLEYQLQRKWSAFGREGKEVPKSFLSSLGELKDRARRLEWLLGPSLPPVNDALEIAA